MSALCHRLIAFVDGTVVEFMMPCFGNRAIRQRINNGIPCRNALGIFCGENI